MVIVSVCGVGFCRCVGISVCGIWNGNVAVSRHSQVRRLRSASFVTKWRAEYTIVHSYQRVCGGFVAAHSSWRCLVTVGVHVACWGLALACRSAVVTVPVIRRVCVSSR